MLFLEFPNSCRAASPLVRLVEGEEMWKASDHPQGVLPQNWGGIKQIALSPPWCSKLRLTTDPKNGLNALLQNVNNINKEKVNMVINEIMVGENMNSGIPVNSGNRRFPKNEKHGFCH
ncbi:hypothetical protein TNCV_1510551 [Trichonephila clavipes]|nr:hypothetical protein TNCV_1510551 [Trichonephila clavipes]